MLDAPLPTTMADMPVQRPADPRSAAETRARFFNSGNAFNVVLPDVPDASFTREPARALDPAAPTGFIACDLSADLGCAGPTTTPLVLARYARIRPGERLTERFEATGAIWYVITGAGRSEGGGDSIAWSEGDVFVLPGGVEHAHTAGPEGAVLWVVTNEPLLAFERFRAAEVERTAIDAVHFPAAEIARQLDRIYQVAKGDDTAGFAIIFSSARQEASRNIMPSLTLGLNSLPPGESQRAHRHNSVAVTLVIRGERCWSEVDGRRKEWSPWATTVTPPTAVHSHHNGGDKRALFLIVQDGGLYYHARTMGFSFA
jgi:gentisate 1,2-dioxygenase